MVKFYSKRYIVVSTVRGLELGKLNEAFTYLFGVIHSSLSLIRLVRKVGNVYIFRVSTDYVTSFIAAIVYYSLKYKILIKVLGIFPSLKYALKYLEDMRIA